jgi:spore germination cell wall hydrolase CwlJ-like protein
MGVFSMRKYPLFLILVLALCWLPHLNAYDAEDQVLLARTMTEMAETEPDEVALMIAEVALNRVKDARFPSDLRSVLDDYRQFRRGATASSRRTPSTNRR